jgi:prefoldin subunit 5
MRDRYGAKKLSESIEKITQNIKDMSQNIKDISQNINDIMKRLAGNDIKNQEQDN